MSVAPGMDVWVFHAGSLGDFVLGWPLLRALKRAGAQVKVVTHGAKARLAARELGVRGEEIEKREFSGLWVRDESVSDVARTPTAAPVGGTAMVSFIADKTTEAGRVWAANARRSLGTKLVLCVGAPGTESRRMAWEWARVAELGAAEARENAGGAVVCHVGAGSREKMWSIGRWAELVTEVRGRGMAAEVLAGEVEAERFTPEERVVFERMGGVFEFDLLGLAHRLGSARVFIGADTGPTHLAAQLGVPTLALFGPTDARVWGPVGPQVRVLAPETLRGMDWATPRLVLDAAQRLLSATGRGRADAVS